jgi:hypothetical protein
MLERVNGQQLTAATYKASEAAQGQRNRVLLSYLLHCTAAAPWSRLQPVIRDSRISTIIKSSGQHY